MKSNSNFIQVRTGKGVNKDVVYAKGYASIPNKLDLYNYMKGPDGKVRTFKSLFTPSCLDDMKKQIQTKSIFVDGMHSIATDLGILGLAKKYNFEEDDLHDVEAHLKQKRLPLAKITDFDIDDNGLIIGTETNPHFAKVDDEHKRYYDAVTGSLLDGYLKGFSINFDPIDFTSEVDTQGNQVDYINKIDFYGISYHDSPALADNQFTEVCMRSLGNFMKVRTTMEEEKEKKEEVVPPQPKKEEIVSKTDIEAQVQKRVEEELAKKEVAQTQEEMQKQMVEQKKLIEELQKRGEKPAGQEVKAEVPAQSIVPQMDKYGQQINQTPEEATVDEVKAATEELKKPLEDYMARISRPTTSDELGVRQDYQGVPYKAYGQLLALQSEFGLQKQVKPGESPNEYMQRQGLLTGKADMTVRHEAQV